MPSKKRVPQAKSSSWKPWGDHPKVVTANTISGVGGLLLGLFSLWYTVNSQSDQQATSVVKPTPSVSLPSSSGQQLPEPKPIPSVSPTSNSSEELASQPKPISSASPYVAQQPMARQPIVLKAPVQQVIRPRSVSSSKSIPSPQIIQGDLSTLIRGRKNIVGDGNVVTSVNKNNSPSLDSVPSPQIIEGNGNILIDGTENVVGSGNRVNIRN